MTVSVCLSRLGQKWTALNGARWPEKERIWRRVCLYTYYIYVVCIEVEREFSVFLLTSQCLRRCTAAGNQHAIAAPPAACAIYQLSYNCTNLHPQFSTEVAHSLVIATNLLTPEGWTAWLTGECYGCQIASPAWGQNFDLCHFQTPRPREPWAPFGGWIGGWGGHW